MTLSSVRVKMPTESPSRWTWIRAPSSFHSTAAGPVLAKAASTSGAVWASIGAIGRPTSSRNAANASSPSPSAASATAPRSPRSISARRTAATGTPAAFATASPTTAASAPWRMSPSTSARRNACSEAVARAISSRSALRRAATEPGPLIAATEASAASTSATVSVGSSAGGGGSSRSDAHPTPSTRWRGAPAK